MVKMRLRLRIMNLDTHFVNSIYIYITITRHQLNFTLHVLRDKFLASFMSTSKANKIYVEKKCRLALSRSLGIGLHFEVSPPTTWTSVSVLLLAFLLLLGLLFVDIFCSWLLKYNLENF